MPFRFCFTNNQEFNSLAELDAITSKGNNESTGVRNICNKRLNVINDNTRVQIVLKDQVRLLIIVVQIALKD